MFRKLLIANRGEIACRILRTARRLGIVAAVVYSQADARARHVRLADEAWPIGPAPAKESYLDGRAILEAAKRCGAEAIHPGYGFLSENAEFSEACAAAGFVFVGPPPAAIAAMGEKAAAKERMRRAGVPVLRGYQGEDQTLATLERAGLDLGFPLIIKPSAGGGGKGMHIVQAPGDLSASLEAARRIAVSAFGDERLLLERYLPAARHVEVQVLADTHRRVLHLGDRDCSVQRRHQKLIEEAPAPGLDAALRTAMAQAACTAAREIGYVGAGTVEMLLDGSEFYFMEMNTRLQVEHPVTEAITGLDLVEWQLRIAAGEALPFAQSDIVARGHAVEARVCAEDPAQDFLPGAGTLRLARWPHGAIEGPGGLGEGLGAFPARASAVSEGAGVTAPGVPHPAAGAIRVDRGFETGDVVPPHYDSLLGKVVVHAATRAEALARLHAALCETLIAGVPTNVEWLAEAVQSPAFRAGPVDTSFVARYGSELGALGARGARSWAAEDGGSVARRRSAGSAGGAGSAKGDSAAAGSLAPFAAAAYVFAVRRGMRETSPWALMDGWRLGGAGPIRVALSRTGEPSQAGEPMHSQVQVIGGTTVRAGLDGAARPESAAPGAVELELADAAEPPLIELRPSGGGARAYALVENRRIDLWREGRHAQFQVRDDEASYGAARRPAGSLTAALPGVVVSVHAAAGQPVAAGDALVVIEAMKMEHTVRAPQDGVVETVHVRAGDRVQEGSTLVTLAA